MKTYNEFNYCAELKSILSTRQAIGRSGKVFNELAAISTENNLIVLHNLMLQLKPQKTLEIGLAFGASCLAIASCHRELEHQPNQQHIAIDPYQVKVWDDTARILLEREALLDYVNIREDFSHSVLPQLVYERQKFDLIYIDGSHLFEDVFIDFYYSNKLLNSKGILLFDDSTVPHVRKVLKFIESNFKFSYKRFDLTNFRPKTQNLKYTIAALIGRTQLTAYQKNGDDERPYDAIFRDF